MVDLSDRDLIPVLDASSSCDSVCQELRAKAVETEQRFEYTKLLVDYCIFGAIISLVVYLFYKLCKACRTRREAIEAGATHITHVEPRAFQPYPMVFSNLWCRRDELKLLQLLRLEQLLRLRLVQPRL